MRERQAAWARWLDGQPRPAHRLALTHWARDRDLGINETAAVVAGVLGDLGIHPRDTRPRSQQLPPPGRLPQHAEIVSVRCSTRAHEDGRKK